MIKKYFLPMLILVNGTTFLFSHCQVPCGLYNDATRILQIIENFETIRKGMSQIIELSDNSDSLSKNQLNRWIITKEEHANNIQHIVSDYFLTQRIKKNSKNYIEQTLLMQQLLVLSMHCKQTVNFKNVNEGIELIDSFAKLYLTQDEMKYLKKLKQ